MASYQHIVVLTGAGLSSESGLSTFRDKDGLWSKYRIEDVATPEAFARDPEGVLAFYNRRRRRVIGTRPNAGHVALARLEAEFPAKVTTVTQNIDPLHERAGTRNVIHMHGEILKALCMHCGTRRRWEMDLAIETACGTCGRTGGLRPDVVWFGEMPYEMDRIADALATCDLFISVGTSGSVYPAAGFAARALSAGAHTVELNLEPSRNNALFAEAIHGKASEVVPDYVEKLLAG
ncbi:MAG: NAD-dependent deacylase [Bauldia sp.]|nr:NAD-dependent deacylase [Bauldia sp.]